MPKQQYSKDVKRRIVEELIKDGDWRRVSIDYKLSSDTLLSWLCDYLNGHSPYYLGPPTVDPAMFESEEDYKKFMAWEDHIYESVADVGRRVAKNQEKAANSAEKKRQRHLRSEERYWPILTAEIDGMSDDEIVKSVERLAEDVKEVGQAKLAGQDQEKYKWIDEFIRRVWAYKPAIEAEITRDPEASDSQIAKRVQMHAIPSPQRVDAQYATNAARIETYVRWIRGLAC